MAHHSRTDQSPVPSLPPQTQSPVPSLPPQTQSPVPSLPPQTQSPVPSLPPQTQSPVRTLGVAPTTDWKGGQRGEGGGSGKRRVRKLQVKGSRVSHLPSQALFRHEMAILLNFTAHARREAAIFASAAGLWSHQQAVSAACALLPPAPRYSVALNPWLGPRFRRWRVGGRVRGCRHRAGAVCVG